MPGRSLGREADQRAELWWREAVIYQIYPRSFMDASGDGVGDLAGITEKLVYLSWLGVDAIWLSPIFPSPMVDLGYEVADYTGVDPLFGSLEDFDALLEEAHGRGLKVILDYVPNHTSSEHPWFLESRSSRENPKRDWYVWADPRADGSRPNNWESAFGSPAWTFDAATGQYYLHLFDPAQPDLNWRNPAVREAMYEVLRFWFERGVDGFRIDVLWLLIKDEQMRVNPPNPDWRPGGWTWEKHLRVYSEDRHEIVRERRAVADEYEDRVLIGEIYLPLERLLVYYGEDLSPNAGFCRKGVAPWLPVGGDVERDNVEAQRDDPGAMLSLTRRLISLRRTTPALRSGSYEPAAGAPEGCFAFSRRLDEQEAFVALNLGTGETEEPLPRTANDRPWRVLLSTHGESQEGRELRRAVRLGGYEGLLLTLDHS